MINIFRFLEAQMLHLKFVKLTCHLLKNKYTFLFVTSFYFFESRLTTIACSISKPKKLCFLFKDKDQLRHNYRFKPLHTLQFLLFYFSNLLLISFNLFAHEICSSMEGQSIIYVLFLI